MAELKPCECPFCKNKKYFDIKIVPIGDIRTLYCVHCVDCQARGPSKDTPVQAIDAWNKRS